MHFNLDVISFCLHYMDDKPIESTKEMLNNQAPTNLALHDAKTSEDKLSITYNLQSIIVTQVYTKQHKNAFI